MAAACAAAGAFAPAFLHAQGVYTCTDASGRRLSADRPMIECIDREQRELSPNGNVRRTIKPAPTAAERAAQEEQDRKEAAERARLVEERLRSRALLVRYPDAATLERERSAAQATLEDVIGSVNRRMADLLVERRRLEEQAEFYKGNPGRMPATLRRARDDNDNQLKAQERFLAGQQSERDRIQRQFDQMQKQLEPLWGGTRRSEAPATSAQR